MLGIPSGNLAVWHRGWIRVQCVCVFGRERESKWVLQRRSPPLSSFWGQRRLYLLTRLELWDSFTKRPIMVWGHNMSHSHTQTHSHTDRVTPSQVIEISPFQCYRARQRQNVMMRWIPEILNWSGLLLTIEECCRQLPNISPGWNKTKSIVLTLMKSWRGKGNRFTDERNAEEKWRVGQRLNISHHWYQYWKSFFVPVSFTASKSIYSVLTSEGDKFIPRIIHQTTKRRPDSSQTRPRFIAFKVSILHVVTYCMALTTQQLRQWMWYQRTRQAGNDVKMISDVA